MYTMKKITLLFGAFLTLFLISCEGPQGPPGPPGLDGFDGIDGEAGIQGQVFEVNGVNLGYDVEGNLFQTALAFQDYTSFEVLPNDAVLVYRFDGVAGFPDGSEFNSWGLLPQNFFLEGGTIQYVTSHTEKDVQILIDGNFDLANISTDFTDDQIFRIVIIPGVAAATAKMDRSNIESVMKSLGLTEKDVQRIQIN